MKRLTWLLLLTAFALPLAAQTSSYERVLVPLLLDGVPGASGTAWSSELAVRNEGDVPVPLFGQLCAYLCTCGVPCSPTLPPLAPHASLDDDVFVKDHTGADPARLIHIQRPFERNIAFNLRLYEESRRETELGIEVPVVREAELLDTASWLINVPMRPSSRTHLRLYAVESSNGNALVRVRIYPGESQSATFDQVAAVSAIASSSVPMPGDYNTDPGYAILLLGRELAAAADTVRIHVEPLTPGLRYWMMASATSTVTHNVTLITPQ